MSVNRALAPKDAAVFKSALEHYEAKKYDEALKDVDTVLKKKPNHGESLCLKGLILYHLKRPEEGLVEIQQGLKEDPASPVSWHIAGIYHKLQKNFQEAYGAYLQSYKIDQQNPNIQQDLSMLAMQERKYNVLVDVRRKHLSSRPALHMAWLGLAVSQQLNQDYAAAEKTLDLYESLLVSEKRLENETPQQKVNAEVDLSELYMYRNNIIAESGDFRRALVNLEKIEGKVLDKLAVRESRARYYAALGDKAKAISEYRKLVKRNANNLEYYLALEKLLDIKSVTDLTKFYAVMRTKYPRAEVPQSRPLEFLEGQALEDYLVDYIQAKINRGVPSTFALVKDLYVTQKSAMARVVSRIVEPEEPENLVMWLLFLARHYSYSGKHDEALATIDRALEHTPTLVDLYLAKGKILLRQYDVVGAADVLDQASKMDTGDRFLNTKASKYALLANEIDKGVELASIFPLAGGLTKNAMKYMVDLEAVDFLTRLAKAYARDFDRAMALKYALSVVKTFAQYHREQYDFHYYGPRRGTVRAYLQLVDWEDHLFEHPRYKSAAKIAITEYIAQARGAFDGLSDEERSKRKKRRAKLAKEIQERAPEAPKEGELPEEPDTDPFGFAVFETKDLVGEALKVWTPLSKARPEEHETWELAFEIYLAQNKYVLALQMIKKARDLGALPSWVAAAAVRLTHQLNHDSAAPAAVRTLQTKMLPSIVEGDLGSTDLAEYCDTYVTDDLVWAQTRCSLGKLDGVEARLAQGVAKQGHDVEDAFLLLKKHGLGQHYAQALRSVWPRESFVAAFSKQ